jgi:hypothetical protein
MILKRLGQRALLAMLTSAAWQGSVWQGSWHASAQEVSLLRGQVFIAGKTPVDPPPGESKHSHAYLTISGPAALRMYRAMRAKEEPNECETGKKLKRAGSLSCSMTGDRKAATCDFSVDLIKGGLDDGRPC